MLTKRFEVRVKIHASRIHRPAVRCHALLAKSLGCRVGAIAACNVHRAAISEREWGAISGISIASAIGCPEGFRRSDHSAQTIEITSGYSKPLNFPGGNR